MLSGPGVGGGTPFTSDLEGGIAFDGGNNRLLVTDDGADAIIAVNLANGDRSPVSDDADMGPPFDTIYGIALDATNNRAFVADSGLDGVVEVDLANGNRTLISADGVRGTGVALTVPRDVDIDLANNRVLVVGTGADALVSVNLATGDRTIISDLNTGIGPNFNSPRGVTYDMANNRALVADAGNGAEGIVAVDLADGNRTEISGPNQGMTIDLGADFDSTRGVVIDTANNRLIAVDDEITALVAIDTATGDRTLIEPFTPPEPSVGNGPALVNPTGIVYDAARDAVYIADDGANAIIAVDLATGDRQPVANESSPGEVVDEPRGLGFDPANKPAPRSRQRVRLRCCSGHRPRDRHRRHHFG